MLKACEVKDIAQTLGRVLDVFAYQPVVLGYELAASGENKEKM